jgi:hypothetical protein
MISSTEGEIMPVRKKRTINKDTVGTLVKSDAMTELDDGTEGFEKLNKAMVQLYWAILRDMEEYQKDYAELQKNKKVGAFTDKWSLHDPIDPKEDNPNPFYFYPDNVPFMRVKTRKVEVDSYCLSLDLDMDIRRNIKELTKEIEKIIIREQNKVLEGKRYKNLLGDKNIKTDKEYDNIIYIYNKKKKEGKEPEEIYKRSITDKRGFHSKGSLVHYYRMIDDLINDFPVPIRK